MFTLKLYRRVRPNTIGLLNAHRTKILAYHHIDSFPAAEHTIELRAFHGPEPSTYDGFYIGERTAEMTAVNDDNHWDWGLLENAAGRTTEHFRPHSYG